MEVLVFAVFAVMAVFAASFAFAAIRRVSRWNRTYERLGKRYAGRPGRGGGVAFGLGLTKPSLTFDYGRTLCAVRNRKSFRFAGGYHTEVSMIWPTRRLKLELSTSPYKSRNWGPGALQQVVIDDPQFQSDYYVSGNDPHLIQRLLTPGVQWQIQQLRRHMRNDEVQITINRGNLVVYKPGYLKDYVSLEDFVRYCLELFDQLMLVNADGIEFVNANQASVVDNVRCPICSELILQNVVVCSRCKTPHCQDCWQYNGQCATFACSETRCLYMGNVT